MSKGSKGECAVLWFKGRAWESLTWEGESGWEKGASVQMMLSLDRGLMVKKEQGRVTESPWTTSTLSSLMVTLTASAQRGTRQSGPGPGQWNKECDTAWKRKRRLDALLCFLDNKSALEKGFVHDYIIRIKGFEMSKLLLYESKSCPIWGPSRFCVCFCLILLLCSLPCAHYCNHESFPPPPLMQAAPGPFVCVGTDRGYWLLITLDSSERKPKHISSQSGRGRTIVTSLGLHCHVCLLRKIGSTLHWGYMNYHVTM